jgi:hypothetical protein
MPWLATLATEPRTVTLRGTAEPIEIVTVNRS